MAINQYATYTVKLGSNELCGTVGESQNRRQYPVKKIDDCPFMIETEKKPCGLNNQKIDDIFQ